MTTTKAKTEKANPIDELMEKASGALLQADYFECVKLCTKALMASRRIEDYERIARIALPLQESRRQIRLRAVDTGFVFVLDKLAQRSADIMPGCYLVQPPLIGLEARQLREQAEGRQTPVFVLCREPLTRAGKWPVVAVGDGTIIDTLTIRLHVDPPPGVERTDQGMTKDRLSGPPPISWMLAAHEALGDHAIAALKPADHPAWRVDDLLAAITALPEHEKLYQRLEGACREAAAAGPAPTRPRRGRHDDSTSF